jgi:hypothetical protein
MPGAFAGPLARCQAFFHILYNSCTFAGSGKTETGEYLINEGLSELADLKQQIDSGEIEKRYHDERRAWAQFTRLADRLQPEKVRQVLQPFMV